MISETLEQTTISFNPEWFQSGYYVYVLTIKHKDKRTFYYVGQTGDRKHNSARSPFYRLMAHFSPYTSTDNQLVKGIIGNSLIVTTLEKSVRVCLEEAFCKRVITVKSDYFRIEKFDQAEHSIRRKHVEAIEQILIDHFIKENKTVFNTPGNPNSKKVERNEEAYRIAQKIIGQLKEQ